MARLSKEEAGRRFVWEVGDVKVTEPEKVKEEIVEEIIPLDDIVDIYIEDLSTEERKKLI